MGWQDIIGGALTGFATGNPMAWKNSQLEQAFKQFQMQQMTNDLEMKREMHGMEKQKLDILLKQKQRDEELENSPVAGILKLFNIEPPEGSENVTVGQANIGSKIAIPLLEQKSRAEDRKLRDEDRDLDRQFKLFNLSETTKQREADRESRKQMHDETMENQRILKSLAQKGNERKPHEIGKDAAGLRKELNALPEVKEYNTVKTKISAMESAYKEAQTTKNFVAADQAMITLFNKMTDPQSVVRESEYARTGVSMPLINAIKGKANKVISGGAGLTSSERDAIMKMARLFDGSYKQMYGERVKEYRGYATMQGLDPNMIAKDMETKSDPLGIR